ncbi:DUF748 domain-containing protein [Bordetella sp. 2513F-2]
MHLRMPGFMFSRRMGKWVLGFVAVLLALAALLAWQVPKLLRDVLVHDVSAHLGREVGVGEISFNPFTLTVRARELSVAQAGAAPLFEAVELEASASWASLLRMAPVIDAAVLRQPKFVLVREAPTRFNFSDLLERLATQPDAAPAAQDDAGLPRFSLNNLVVEGGVITLDDRVTGRRQVVDALELGVPFISTFRYATDIDVVPHLSLRLNGSPVSLQGTVRPFDTVRSATLDLRFSGLDLSLWADAWPLQLPVTLQHGLLDSDLQLHFEQPADAPPRLRTTGSLGLRQLELREAGGERLLSWNALRLERVALEPLARRLAIGEVHAWGPAAQVVRDAAGQLNWQRVAAGFAAPTASADPQAATPAGEAAQPWQVEVDSIRVESASVQVRDQASGWTYPVAGLALTAEGLTLPQAAGRPLNLWLDMDNPADGSWLRMRGPLTLEPLALQADIQLGNLALAPLAPLVRASAPVEIGEGRLALRTRLDLAGAEWSLANLQAELAGLAARDASLTPPVPFAAGRLALTADSVSPGARPSRFSLQADGLQGEGKLAAQGTLVPQPLSVQARVDLAGFDLASLAPYAASSLNATVRGAKVGARGEASFAAAHEGKPQQAAWRGDLELTDFDLEDRVNRADFLRWGRLALTGTELAMAGERISANLGNVLLDDFYGNVLLDAEGRLNVMDLVAEPGQAGGSITQDTQTRARAPARAAGAGPEIAVNSIRLARGKMTFNDRFVKPNYTAELSAVEGSVSAVSSRRPTPAKVKVGGRVYGSAPFSVTGTVQPFAEFLSLDLHATARGVDLPRFTTYSAKYVGYPIRRGKLSLDVRYQIKDRTLQARNRLVLNQLTFGERTDSPDAIQLPVLLAVSLLKDSRGNIDIDLPVSGSLDDPEFSVGGIVLRVIVNLLTKAVTAPFQLLASAFGGDAELSYVAFEPGSAELDAQAGEAIATLAKALNDRPGLKLDVGGRVDPALDEPALRQAWLEARLREAKARAQSRRGARIDPAGVTLTAEERARYLEQVYDDTDIENKPRNFIGMAKSIPAADMEALLRQAAPVGPESLRALAEARAQGVFEALQAQGPADRIYVVAPRFDADGVDDGGKTTRVDFSLQ